MDNWKIRVQYIDKYDVILDKTEKQARRIFNNLKSKMYEKQIVWCELIHTPIEYDDDNDDEIELDEIVVDSFENKIISIMGHNLIV